VIIRKTAILAACLWFAVDAAHAQRVLVPVGQPRPYLVQQHAVIYPTPIRDAIGGKYTSIATPIARRVDEAQKSATLSRAYRLSPNICQIRVRQGGGVSSVGSGIYIGASRVLSCAHIFRGSADRTGTATFPGGSKVDVSIEAIDTAGDSSLLRTDDEPRGVVAVEWSSIEPETSRAIVLAGYSTGRLGFRAGRFEARWQSGTFSFGAAAVSGDSGGPVIDEHGRLMSNLWGGSGRDCFASPPNSRVIKLARSYCVGPECYPSPPPQPDASRSTPNHEPQTIYPGPEGPTGPTGPTGPAGEITQAHLDDIVRRVVAAIRREPITDEAMADIVSRIPPIYPQWIDDNGGVIDAIPGGVRPGQTLPLRLEVSVEDAIDRHRQ